MREDYPRALADQEQALLQRRRVAARAAQDGGGVGFGLSGGGIRSATFTLGFFQALARAGLLRHVDYLSTVSGGGYFGAFLGQLFRRPEVVTGVDDVEAILAGQPSSRPDSANDIERTRRGILSYLRENGRYLSPRGTGDLLLGAAVLLRNLVSVHLVLAMFVLLALLLAQLAYLPIAPAVAGTATTITAWPLSPYLYLAGLTVVFAAWPTGWAYWLIGHPRSVPRREFIANLGPPVLLLLLSLAALAVGATGVDNATALLLGGTAGSLVAATVLLIFLFTDRALLRLVESGTGSGEDESAVHVAAARSGVSRAFLRALSVAAALLLLGLVDTAGGLLAGWSADEAATGQLTALAATLAGILAGAQRLIARIVPETHERPAIPLAVAALLLALGLLSVYLVIMAALAHGLTGARGVLITGDAAEARSGFAFGAVLILTVLVACFGNSMAFLNRSGHHALYMARLTRAYLGASNPRRHGGADSTVLRVQPGDNTSLQAYHRLAADETNDRARAAAPLHLVNVTVNETIDGHSQIQQRDRGGTTLAFGPCSLSVGIRHHAVFAPGSAHVPDSPVSVFPDNATDPGYRVFAYAREDDADPAYTGEPLSLGNITAISGAAVSTGLGSRTSLAMSVLIGLANVRLGYWWDSGVDPDNRPCDGRPRAGWRRMFTRALPVYSFLLGELLARFRGTAWRHWYLSDGGHFENLGGYELIRRRLPLIVLVDAEADPDGTFDGLAGLIRKARTDFGADIRFLDETALTDMGLARRFGPLEQLRHTRPLTDARNGARKGHTAALCERHFALARVRYRADDGEAPDEGWLVYVKPTLTGAEPADLIEYLHRHPAFPHEPTSDQFFGESQWESYRMLGEHLAGQLCAKGAADGAWDFAELLRSGGVASSSSPTRTEDNGE